MNDRMTGVEHAESIRVVVDEYSRAEREVVWLRSLLREVVASGVPSKDVSRIPPHGPRGVTGLAPEV